MRRQDQRETPIERSARLRMDEAFRKTLASPEGRLVLRWVLKRTQLLEGTFTGSSETFYREGKRSVGIDLYAQLKDIDPRAYAALVTEAANEEVAAIEHERAARKRSAAEEEE